MIVKAYFRSQSAARQARVSLVASYRCSQPRMVSPSVQARAWLLEITIPTGPFTVPTPAVLSRIWKILNATGGMIIDDEDETEESA